jgi:hypothetical protein
MTLMQIHDDPLCNILHATDSLDSDCCSCREAEFRRHLVPVCCPPHTLSPPGAEGRCEGHNMVASLQPRHLHKTDT